MATEQRTRGEGDLLADGRQQVTNSPLMDLTNEAEWAVVQACDHLDEALRHLARELAEADVDTLEPRRATAAVSKAVDAAQDALGVLSDNEAREGAA